MTLFLSVLIVMSVAMLCLGLGLILRKRPLRRGCGQIPTGSDCCACSIGRRCQEVCSRPQRVVE